MRLCHCQRASAITSVFERHHETTSHASASGVEPGQPAPPRYRSTHVRCALCVHGERLECLGKRSAQAHSRAFLPTLELLGAVEIEAVHERAGVERNRSGVITRCERV
jgi:hypothetical protein